MLGKRRVKEVRGIVFLDSNNNGIRDGLEQSLKDVGIKLFAVDDTEAQGKKAGEPRVLKEKLILSTKTNARGEFRFLVREGAYSVSLDVETLPVGRGILEANRLFDFGEKGLIDFAVREIDSVYVQDSPLHINIGENFIINPIAKDRDGNILSAKINYLSEGNEIDFRSNMCRALPKSFIPSRDNIILDTGKTRLNIPVEITIPGVCSADKVNLAHRLGMIDENAKIQYLLHALFGRKKLPEDYRSQIPIKSGTRYVEEISNYIERTDADLEIVKAAKQYLDSSIPHLDKTYKSPSGYFNIHYTLSGENGAAVKVGDLRGVPSYIKQVGLAFDHVRAFTCTSRGFREPILDEGKSAYDVYVFDLKGKYGITYSSKIYSMQNVKARVASSYICIDNSYSSQKGFDKNREDCKGHCSP